MADGMQQVGLDPTTMPLEDLQRLVHDRTMEVRARTGRVVPMGSIRFEALLDIVLPVSTPQRETFERVSAVQALRVCDELITAAVREQLLQR